MEHWDLTIIGAGPAGLTGGLYGARSGLKTLVLDEKMPGGAGIEVDEAGYIIVDNRQRTNISGVYAAGDVTNGPVKQIGTAVGQAIVAANGAFGYIKRPYHYKA